MDIVPKLRELRQVSGMTESEVAEKAALSPETVRSFETAEGIMSMTLSQLFQLLFAYDVTPDEFLDQCIQGRCTLSFEDLDEIEMELITAWRGLLTESRRPLAKEFLSMIQAVCVTAGCYARQDY